MKNVYVVCKQGIYGHGIHAILTIKIDAIHTADMIAAKDKDTYHDWCVYKIPLNTVCSAKEREREGFTDALTANNLVYIVRGTR